MTSNKVFVAQVRGRLGASLTRSLMHAFEFRRFHLASAYSVTRGHFESVQAHLKFFPFENITKVMKFVDLAFFW